MSSVPTNLPSDELREGLDSFIRYRKEHLTGDEKGEAAIFLENLFRALGHDVFGRPARLWRSASRSATTAVPPTPTWSGSPGS